MLNYFSSFFSQINRVPTWQVCFNVRIKTGSNLIISLAQKPINITIDILFIKALKTAAKVWASIMSFKSAILPFKCRH